LIFRTNLGGVKGESKITLACGECKQRNYNTMKNKKNDPDRLEMRKYAGSARSILCIKKQNNKKRE